MEFPWSRFQNLINNWPETHAAKDSLLPKVGVVLVNWNGGEFTIPCVESLLNRLIPISRLSWLTMDRRMVLPERIAQRVPQVELLRQPDNSGVPKARNAVSSALSNWAANTP